MEPAVTEELSRLSLAAHNALGLCGYSRADFILNADQVRFLADFSVVATLNLF